MISNYALPLVRHFLEIFTVHSFADT